MDVAPVPAPVPLAVPSRRWRYYRTENGTDPVRTYLDGLAPADRTAVKAQMKLVRDRLRSGRRLDGDVFALTVRRAGRHHQLLFSAEGRHKRVLLGLDAFPSTAARPPTARIRVAQDRLRDWRWRGQGLAAARAPAGSPRQPGRAPLAHSPLRTLGLGR